VSSREIRHAGLLAQIDELREKTGILMYEIEVTVTMFTGAELKLTADWPVAWLRAPGSVEILRKLLPGEIVPPLKEPTRRFEFPVHRGFRSSPQTGDRLVVRCFLSGEGHHSN
jgi:hypothetical protein